MIKFNSLKAKIITLLTLTTLTIAFILLYLFISFYKKDKIAYIFESNGTILDTVGEQFKREVEFSSEIIKVHLENTKINKKLALSSETNLPKDYFLDAMAIYRKVPDFKLVDQLAKPGMEISEGEVAHWINQRPSNDDQTVHVDNFVVTVVSNFSKDQQSWILIYRFQSATLADYFKNADSINTALINKATGIGKHEYPQIDSLTPEQVNAEITKGVLPMLNQTSQTKMMKIENKNYLFSSTRLYQSQWYLSTFVSEDRVLANLQNLMIKSVLFFILISALVVLLSYFSSDYLTHRLKKLTQSAKRIAGGQFDEKIQDSGNDEISTLTMGFNQMSTEISRLLHETANKARMESELKTAQVVQSTLLPNNNYESDFIQIKGCYTSASECGGDWWHYCYVGDKIYMWIGDATGHGAPAALITSAAKSASTLIESLSISPAQAIELMNKAIYDVSKGRIMMTFVLSSLDVKTGELTYVNASHEAPFLLRKEGGSPIKKKNLILLNENNNPRLGQSRDSKYVESKIQLLNQDSFIFYTDGIADIQDQSGKNWGERDFIKNLLESFNGTSDPVSFKNEFANRMKSYRQDSALIDDVTFFIVKYSKA